MKPSAWHMPSDLTWCHDGMQSHWTPGMFERVWKPRALSDVWCRHQFFILFFTTVISFFFCKCSRKFHRDVVVPSMMPGRGRAWSCQALDDVTFHPCFWLQEIWRNIILKTLGKCSNHNWPNHQLCTSPSELLTANSPSNESSRCLFLQFSFLRQVFLIPRWTTPAFTTTRGTDLFWLFRHWLASSWSGNLNRTLVKALKEKQAFWKYRSEARGSDFWGLRKQFFRRLRWSLHKHIHRQDASRHSKTHPRRNVQFWTCSNLVGHVLSSFAAEN